MRITLVGSRHFGVTTLNMLRQHGVEIVRVVVHDAEDRLAASAKAAGIEVVVQADPKLVVSLGDRAQYRPDRDRAQSCPGHQGGAGRRQTRRHRLSPLAAAPPSRHRSDRMDHQGRRSDRRRQHLPPRRPDGCRRHRRPGMVFVKKGETARELWERALAPLGQKLLGDVIDYAKTHKSLPAKPQDEQFATKAPSLPDSKR